VFRLIAWSWLPRQGSAWKWSPTLPTSINIISRTNFSQCSKRSGIKAGSKCSRNRASKSAVSQQACSRGMDQRRVPPTAPECWRGCPGHIAITGFFHKLLRLVRRTYVPHKQPPPLSGARSFRDRLAAELPSQRNLPTTGLLSRNSFQVARHSGAIPRAQTVFCAYC
jgi:hypothetical protein